MTQRPRSGEGGFTLIELLLTLAVSVFGLMAIMALHSSLTKGSAENEHAQEAIVIGSQVVERIRAKRPDAIALEITGSATATIPYTNSSYATLLGRNGLSYTVGVGVSTPDTNLLKIRVDVSWTEDTTGETRSLPIELIRSSIEAL